MDESYIALGGFRHSQSTTMKLIDIVRKVKTDDNREGKSEMFSLIPVLDVEMAHS